MPANLIRLRISTPTGPIAPGRGFYQLEEDALYVQVGAYTAKRQFFSYLEGERIHLEFDRYGTLMFVEAAMPRRQWRVDEDLQAPSVAEPADVRWMDFRATITDPEIVANRERTLVRLRFAEGSPERNYYLADEVIVSVEGEDRLVDMWVGGIVDDVAGKEIGAFRKKNRGNGSFFG